MLNKRLFKLRLENIDFYNLKLVLRQIAKDYYPNIYFHKFENRYNIKNYGCLVFGQPDVWKGLIIINPISEEEVFIEYENHRCLGEEEAARGLIKGAVYALVAKTKDVKIIEDYNERSEKRYLL